MAEGEVTYLDFGGNERAVDRAIEKSMSEHPAGKGVSPEVRALLEAGKWAMRMQISRHAYAEALDTCRELGLSNKEIAEATGKSESAIRMHFERKKEMEA